MLFIAYTAEFLDIVVHSLVYLACLKHTSHLYRARPLSRFRITGSNGQGKAKEGLAEVINIHSRLTNQIRSSSIDYSLTSSDTLPDLPLPGRDLPLVIWEVPTKHSQQLMNTNSIHYQHHHGKRFIVMCHLLPAVCQP